MRRVIRATVALLAVVATLGGAPALTAQPKPKFFADDPVWREVDTQDASKVARWNIDLASDLVLNLFVKLGDPAADVRARNVNTVDEVPDGPYFVNRAGRMRLTPAIVARAANTSNGPAPGKWTRPGGLRDDARPRSRAVARARLLR